MKTQVFQQLCCALILSLIFFTNTTAQQNSTSLSVVNPDRPWDTRKANIDEATLVVTPKGAFMEYGLFLTISADQTDVTGLPNQLEIVMDFKLPDNAIVHDSWLWVGNDIMQALLVDRDLATNIYEGIVSRRRDPSILYKNSDVDYELRIYPLPKSGTRKVKLTYLVPATWTTNKVTAPLPVSLLNLSTSIPNLEYIIHGSDEFSNPRVNEFGFLPISHQSGLHEYTGTIPGFMLESSNALSIAFDAPLTDGFYASTYAENGNSGYYQMVVHPAKALGLNPSKKVTVLLEYKTPYSEISANELMGQVKGMLHEYLADTDSFNLIFASNSIHKVSNSWMPADSQKIEDVFAILPVNWLSKKFSVEPLIKQGVDFIKGQNSGGELLLISNSNDYQTPNVAAKLMDDLGAPYLEAGVPVNIVNYYSAGYNYNYYNNNYAVGNDLVFKQITNTTNGIYTSHTYTTESYSDINDPWFDWYYYSIHYAPSSTLQQLMHKAFSKLGGAFVAFAGYAEPDGGFTTDRFETPDEESLGYDQAFIQIGRYYGANGMDIKLVFSGLADTNFVGVQQQYTPHQSDSLLGKMWAGCKIEALEEDHGNTQAIKNVSKDYRVLSRHTAFLALEPNDTVEACADCLDESNPEVPSSVGIEETAAADIYMLEASPNPFTHFATFSIQLPADEDEVVLNIYNITGQLVRSFVIQPQAGPQNYKVIWDGKLENGGEAAKGVYLAVLQTSKGQQTIKVIKS